MAGILAGGCRWQIVLAGPIYLYVNNRALNQQLAERDLASERRQYLYSHRQLIGVQEWRLIGAFGPT